MIEDGLDSLKLGICDSPKYHRFIVDCAGIFENCPLDSAYVGRNLAYTFASKDALATICHAFAYSKIKNITIGDSVTSIGNWAFERCTDLNKITIGDSVTSIGNYAFQKCTALKEVSIGSSVSSVGDYAFNQCTDLNKIASLNPTPPTLGSNCFSNYSATLYVPPVSLEAYKAADNWKNFLNMESVERFVAVEDSVKIGHFLYTLYKDGTADLIGFAEVLPANVTVPAKVEYGDATYRCPILKRDPTQWIKNLNATDRSMVVSDSILGKVETLTFAEGIDSIAWHLMYFPHCKTVNFPKSVTKLAPHTFFSGIGGQGYRDVDRYDWTQGNAFNYYFHDFEAFNVDPENPAFTSVDGVIYTKDMKTLVRYPHHKTTGKAVIPEGVEVLAGGSLCTCEFSEIELPSTLKTMETYVASASSQYGSPYGCVFLKNLVIPEGVTRLEHRALAYLVSLETLKLPNTLRYVGGAAIYRADSLKTLGWQDCEIDSLGYTQYADGSISNYGSAVYADNWLISLPKVVKHISDNALHGKTPANLHLPRGVEEVGKNIFCLPNSLSKSAVDSIKNIYIYDKSWLIADTLLFGTIIKRSGRYRYEVFPTQWASTCKVYVPTGTLEEYKASALWSRFPNMEEWDTKTDGIKQTTADQRNRKATGVYTLQGVKVANRLEDVSLPPGIYIIDGKKVQVK